MKLHLTKIYRQWMRDGLAQEALGIEMGTVMSRLFYARKRLAQTILSFPQRRESKRGSPLPRG